MTHHEMNRESAKGAKKTGGENKNFSSHSNSSLSRILRFGGATLLAAFGFASLPLAAQEAPEPNFDLIGDIAQKFTYTAKNWTDEGANSWSFTADLKPRFTYGAVSFQADSTWTLPMTASLASAAPTVAVPEAYFRISPTDSFDLTFGQKRFAIGVGQTFTVGDSLNPVIGFFDQKTGFRGFTAEWSPVSWASLSGAVSGEQNAATFAGQASGLFDEVQVTASAVQRRDVTFNPALGLSYDLFGVIVTAEGAAEFLPQGVRPAGAANTWKAPAPWSAPLLSGSFGARWALPTVADWDITVSGEYLHWAQGWNKDETDAWKAALGAGPPSAALAGAARKTLPLRSQENAFFRLIVSTGGVFSVSGFAALDLQDQSVLGQGTVTWTPWDNLDLSASLQAAQGEAGSAWEYLTPNKDRYQASFSTTYHF